MAYYFLSRFIQTVCRGGGEQPLLTSPIAFLLLVLTFHAAFLADPVQANVCSGCYNGGQLFLPNNIFGPCRCLCEGNYAGPQCEFVGKRSAQPALGPDDSTQDLSDPEDDDTRLQSKLNLLKDIWRRLKIDEAVKGNNLRKRRMARSQSGSHADKTVSKRDFVVGNPDDWL